MSKKKTFERLKEKLKRFLLHTFMESTNGSNLCISGGVIFHCIFHFFLFFGWYKRKNEFSFFEDENSKNVLYL